MSKVLAALGTVRKALVAVAGVAAQLIAVGVLHGTVLHWVQVALGALAAAGVYAVPNAAKPKAAPAAPAAPPAKP